MTDLEIIAVVVLFLFVCIIYGGYISITDV
jgi:hypothetical protein